MTARPKTRDVLQGKQEWCTSMRDKYGVVPDVSWGKLPEKLFQTWKEKGCNDLVPLNDRTQKLQNAPDAALAATNKAKRSVLFKPFKLRKSEVKAHQWLQAGKDTSFGAEVQSLKGYDGGRQFQDPAGKNHYQLFSYMGKLLTDVMADAPDKVQVCDIGSKFGDSIRAWTTGSDKLFVHSYDLADVPQMISDMQVKHGQSCSACQRLRQREAVVDFYKDRVKFHRVDINASPEDMEICLQAPLIMLDVEHQPVEIPMEYEFIKQVIEGGFRGVMLCDDIDLNRDMKDWWQWLPAKRPTIL